jgi:hypothetical protein
VLDEKATLFNRIGEDWLDEAAKRLKEIGNENRVLLDYSWGSNDPENRVRKLGLAFVPGAVAATYVSSDARTFDEPPGSWQPTDNWNDKQIWFAGSP